MQNSGRKQIKYKFPLIGNNGMSGIVSSLIADNNICLFRKKINNTSFTFVTPLSTN